MKYWELLPKFAGNERQFVKHRGKGSERDFKREVLWCELAYDIDKTQIEVTFLDREEYLARCSADIEARSKTKRENPRK